MTLFLNLMHLIDIHTHSVANDGNIRIVDAGTSPVGDTLCSVGIHPWKITGEWKCLFAEVKAKAAAQNVVAIGECGFDFVNSSASQELQYEVFIAHAKLSEELQKPLVIHLVKGQQLLLKAAKELSHVQAWIIHGFRGKPEQAAQLLAAGMYLSFGEYFNAAAVAEIPSDKLFVESDESVLSLFGIYNGIAAARECSVDELLQNVAANACRCRLLSKNI